MNTNEEYRKLRQTESAPWEAWKNNPMLQRLAEQEKEQERKQRQIEERIRSEREEAEQRRRRRDMQDNSIRYFMKEAADLRFDPQVRTPSACLYEAYCRWCHQEDLFPEPIRAFCIELKRNAREYKIAPTNFVWQGRHIRGFRGVALMQGSHMEHG